MSSRVFSWTSSFGTHLITLHPSRTASLYFSMSWMNPFDLMCRPRVQTPPSTSRASL